ncbi:hypothetical protein TWF569_009079 [Orbilia oligospora]|nr:hypothetical protein TWF569_009079 [Orbilia oligospora]
MLSALDSYQEGRSGRLILLDAMLLWHHQALPMEAESIAQTWAFGVVST